MLTSDIPNGAQRTTLGIPLRLRAAAVTSELNSFFSRPRLRPAVRAWASGSSGKLNDGKMNAAKGFALVAWHFSNRHRLLPPPHVVKITNSRNICSAAPKHSLQGRSAHAIRATLRQTAMILAQKKTARRGGLLALLTWGTSISRTLECLSLIHI